MLVNITFPKTGIAAGWFRLRTKAPSFVSATASTSEPPSPTSELFKTRYQLPVCAVIGKDILVFEVNVSNKATTCDAEQQDCILILVGGGGGVTSC